MVTNMIQESNTQVLPFDAQAQVFKVLTHPARIAILEILRDGEHCVCHLEAFLGLRQAYISQQLAVLREGGLIQDRREGWNIYYRVIDHQIYEVLDAMYQMSGMKKPQINHASPCDCPVCSIH